MLTQNQEDRLREALGVIVDSAPKDTTTQPQLHEKRSLRQGWVAVAAFVVVVAAFLPFYLSDPDQPDPAAPATPVVPDLIEPQQMTSPGEVRLMAAHDGRLYASTSGASDRVHLWDDGWTTVFEVSPGDAEGLFGVGDVVVMVTNDDNPARDTVEPSSVVTTAPRVTVFDPRTGTKVETTLPRPEDPPLEGIPLDGSVAECALGGYQSWVGASSVAVGDRIIVTGSHNLVGRLEDGSLICDGQNYRRLVWYSDDKGATWQMTDSPPISDVTWTGSAFVAWETADGVPTAIAASIDGLVWSSVASVPAIGARGFSIASLDSGDGLTVALISRHEWDAVIPDVNDPEELREVLQMALNVDMADYLERGGIDLPLDENEKQLLASWVGTSHPVDAVIGVSRDGGLTWEMTPVDAPISAVAAADGSVAALTSEFATQRSTVLFGTPAEWSTVVELPGLAYGDLAVAEGSLFVLDRTDRMWRVPLP